MSSSFVISVTICLALFTLIRELYNHYVNPLKISMCKEAIDKQIKQIIVNKRLELRENQEFNEKMKSKLIDQDSKYLKNFSENLGKLWILQSLNDKYKTSVEEFDELNEKLEEIKNLNSETVSKEVDNHTLETLLVKLVQSENNLNVLKTRLNKYNRNAQLIAKEINSKTLINFAMKKHTEDNLANALIEVTGRNSATKAQNDKLKRHFLKLKVQYTDLANSFNENKEKNYVELLERKSKELDFWEIEINLIKLKLIKNLLISDTNRAIEEFRNEIIEAIEYSDDGRNLKNMVYDKIAETEEDLIFKITEIGYDPFNRSLVLHDEMKKYE